MSVTDPGLDETPRDAAEIILPLVEERLRIGKLRTDTGGVRVRTFVDTVEEVARADLEHETIEIERVAIGRRVDSRPPPRVENGTTIISVVEEILVTEKRLVLVEEIRLHRRVRTEPFAQTVTLRRQRATVERLPAEAPVGRLPAEAPVGRLPAEAPVGRETES